MRYGQLDPLAEDVTLNEVVVDIHAEGGATILEVTWIKLRFPLGRSELRQQVHYNNAYYHVLGVCLLQGK